MSEQITKLQADVAKAANCCFEMAERLNVETGKKDYFVHLRKDAQDRDEKWVKDLVHKAHGDLLPDDYCYKTIWEALERIKESAGSDWELIANEFADDVDVMNRDLLDWLASNSIRIGYVDDACEEFGADGKGIMERIQLGQYQERQEIFYSVRRSIEECAKEIS